MQANKKLMDDLVKYQFEQHNQLVRQSQGDFTPADIRQIRQANRHQVNRVASDVAQRGLGTSEAGVDFIAQAQRAPFDEAQQRAQAALPAATQAAFNIGKQLIGDDSFIEDLGHVTKLLTTLRGQNRDRTDPNVDGAVGDLVEIQKGLLRDLGGPGDISVEDKLRGGGTMPEHLDQFPLRDRAPRPLPELGSILDK